MSDDRRLEIARRLPRFQFSILNVLVLTAAVAACLGVMKMNLALGVMAAVLLLGAWSTAIAVAHAWNKTAFLLAAFVAGVPWYLAMSIPVSFAGLLFWSEGHWPNLAVLGCLCGASLTTAVLLRPWLDGQRFEFSAWNMVAPSYVMGFSWVALWNVSCWLGIVDAEGTGFSWDVVLGTAAIVTLSLHVGAPTGMVLLEVVRDVEKMAIDMGRAEDDVVEAVDVLLTLEKSPISAKDVARQAGCDLATAEHFLALLTRSGYLAWNAEEGYHRRPAWGAPASGPRPAADPSGKSAI